MFYSIYLDIPTLAAGEDEVMDDALIGNFDWKSVRSRTALGTSNQKRSNLLTSQNINCDIPKNQCTKWEHCLSTHFSVCKFYLESPGWYQGADLRDSSSFSVSQFLRGTWMEGREEEWICCRSLAIKFSKDSMFSLQNPSMLSLLSTLALSVATVAEMSRFKSLCTQVIFEVWRRS